MTESGSRSLPDSAGPIVRMMSVERGSLLRHYRLRSFGQLLVAMIIVTIAQPFLYQYRLLQILTLLVLLDGIYIAIPRDVGTSFIRAVNFLWAAAALFVIAGHVSTRGIFRDSADVAGAFFQTALYAICVSATLRYVLRERHVTLDLIFAAISGYFFIVATFSGIYLIAMVLDPEAIQFQAWIASQPHVDIRSQLSYFSFVTAASLGYGDIVPRNPYVQMIAVIEVVVGQFYLATVIARLVSIYGSAPVTSGRVDE